MTPEEWTKEYLEFYIWNCGDELCNCNRPVVEHVTPNHVAGHPWINRKRIWEGTFISDPDYEEYETLRQELIDKAKSYNVTLDEDYYGRKEV